MKTSRGQKVVLFLIVLFIGFISVYPMIWMFFSSFKSGEQILGGGVGLLPDSWHPENYGIVFERAPFAKYFLNSLGTTLVIMLIQLVTSALIAYAIAEFKFKGKFIVTAIIAAMYMVPSDITYIPGYIILSNAGLNDSLVGYVLSNAANLFMIFLFAQGFRNSSHSVIEAARVDGLSEWSILWRVVIPMNKNLVIIGAITSFIANFNSYRWPNILLTSPDNYMIQQGLSIFSTSQGSFVEMFPVTMAASVLTLIPCLLVYSTLSKYFIGTMSASTVKG